MHVAASKDVDAHVYTCVCAHVCTHDYPCVHTTVRAHAYAHVRTHTACARTQSRRFRAYTPARPRIHARAHTRTMKAIKDAHARELAELRAKLAASERAREDTVPRPFCSRTV